MALNSSHTHTLFLPWRKYCHPSHTRNWTEISISRTASSEKLQSCFSSLLPPALKKKKKNNKELIHWVFYVLFIWFLVYIYFRDILH